MKTERSFSLIEIAIYVITVALIIAIGIRAYSTAKNCARWETKIVKQEGYTSFSQVGDVVTSTYHPPRDVEQQVCVELRASESTARTPQPRHDAKRKPAEEETYLTPTR